jgi:HlyD family secretion protein
VGQVVSQGQRLFSVNGSPVVLLYGSVPAWRSLSRGLSGPDVAELNADLVALDDATNAQIATGSDEFTSATETAVDAFQAHLGVAQTGSVALGQVDFLPTAVRVTTVSATLGGSTSGGQQVLEASSTARLVTITLDASQLSEIKVGDAVTITLPDGQDTPGAITAVGTTATAAPSNGPPGSGPSGPPTVQVTVTPSDPAATGTVDQAPVTVGVTIAAVGPSLGVPVAALTTSIGHPAVDVVESNGAHHLVPVSVGIVDDANGRVEVSGAGLAAGQRVVVPA